MSKGKSIKGEWVVAGGAPGELGYCTRCGEGLAINLPQRVEVITAAMKAFVKTHLGCPAGRYLEKPTESPDEWVTSRDTGTSSLTIYSAITGKPSPYQHFDVPHDPDDFGRCYRLLKLFPQWRKHLAKTINICGKWKPFVEQWDELTALYEEELSSGVAPKLYDRITELRGLQR